MRPGVYATTDVCITLLRGDGIMSAVDFDMRLERRPIQREIRVKITMSASFFPTSSGAAF